MSAIRHILIILAFFSFVPTALAEGSGLYDDAPLEFEENLRTPEVKPKFRSSIVAYQNSVGKSLKSKGYQVESIRNGEVLVVTIPAHKLFAPNQTELLGTAENVLGPIFSLLNKVGYYKMLLDMHSDNTGNALYSETLTNDRVISIADWAESKGYASTYIIPYSSGRMSPIYSNNSIVNRQKNRRLDIYLVPADLMVQLAKSNSLK